MEDCLIAQAAQAIAAGRNSDGPTCDLVGPPPGSCQYFAENSIAHAPGEPACANGRATPAATAEALQIK